jgi:hypothetical protein
MQRTAYAPLDQGRQKKPVGKPVKRKAVASLDIRKMLAKNV